jgi:hypothetical protein
LLGSERQDPIDLGMRPGAFIQQDPQNPPCTPTERLKDDIASLKLI